jgi:hypothetical protein
MRGRALINKDLGFIVAFIIISSDTMGYKNNYARGQPRRQIVSTRFLQHPHLAIKLDNPSKCVPGFTSGCWINSQKDMGQLVAGVD